MTRDEVIRLALKAGFTWEPINNIADPLESFAALVMEAKDGPWKAAVIDQLVVAHILTAEHETDPRKAVQDLMAFESDIAIDPRVSGAAAALVEQAKAEEREAWPDLTCVIQWLEAGCDPKDAAKELSLYQAAISARSKA